MPVPPPPPPPPPPPAATQGPIPKSNKQLLQSIEKGTKLKKVPETAKNDRSSGLIAAGATPGGASGSAKGPPTSAGGAPMARPQAMRNNGPMDFQSELQNQLILKKTGVSGPSGGLVTQDRKPSMPLNNYVSVRPSANQHPAPKTTSPSNQSTSLINGKKAESASVPFKPFQPLNIANREAPPPAIPSTNKPSANRAPPALTNLPGKPSIQSQPDSNRHVNSRNQFDQSSNHKGLSSPVSPFQVNSNNNSATNNRFETPPMTNNKRPSLCNQNQQINNLPFQQPNSSQSTNYRPPNISNQNQSNFNKAPQQTHSNTSTNYRQPSTINQNQPITNMPFQQLNITRAPQPTKVRPPSTSNQNQSMISRDIQPSNPTQIINNRPLSTSNENQSLNHRVPPPNPVQSITTKPPPPSNQNQLSNNRAPQSQNQFQPTNNRAAVATNQNISSSNRAPPAPNQIDHRAAPPPPPPSNSKPTLSCGLSEEYILPSSIDPVRAASSASNRSAPNIPINAHIANKPVSYRSAPAPQPPLPSSSSSILNDQRDSTNVSGSYKITDRAPPPPPPSHPSSTMSRNYSAFDKRFKFPDESLFPVL